MKYIFSILVIFILIIIVMLFIFQLFLEISFIKDLYSDFKNKKNILKNLISLVLTTITLIILFNFILVLTNTECI